MEHVMLKTNLENIISENLRMTERDKYKAFRGDWHKSTYFHLIFFVIIILLKYIFVLYRMLIKIENEK